MAILFNLGCKLNQYEGFCLQKYFSDREDVVIVNTCCVTKEAEVKSFRKFRQIIKQFSKSKVIATGCVCRLHPEKFNKAFRALDNMARNDLIKNILPAPNKSRYFLKIQDGCNESCAFCIVSKVRDKIESKSVSEIKKEIAWAKSLGFKEIVLVGANIGLYGIDNNSSLIDLLKNLQRVPDLPRIRLSSIEPRFINTEIINTLNDLPICRHFHVPIQSADDRILATMARTYGVSELARSIELLHKNFSDVAIGADIIVGFPGEGSSEFQHTYNFIKTQPFTHLHVFPYSPRPETSAYRLGDPVQYQEKKKRLWHLKELIKEKNYEFRRRLIGKIFEVIIEESNNSISGLTDNYIRVKVANDFKERELIKVKIDEVTKEETSGSVIC